MFKEKGSLQQNRPQFFTGYTLFKKGKQKNTTNISMIV